MSSTTPKVVQIGPYLVIEELGRGCMGVVFRGFDPSIARLVAIKVIRPQLGTHQDTEEAFLRFMREANAAGRLSHPNIVTVYQMGEDRGYQYLAMEFIDGISLNKLMPPGAPMDPGAALAILRQIADALDHAHSQGVVHRDIKPANILVRSDGLAKIADFGIAHVASQTLTQQGNTVGTPDYMAPEQIQGLKVDGRADQFSLAVLAYHMLCGKLPFVGSDEQMVFLAVLSLHPKPAHEANSALSPRTSEILNRGMHKDPERRFPNCSELIRALAASVAAPEPKPAAAVAQVPAVAGPLPSIGRRSAKTTSIAIAASAAAFFAVGFTLLPRSRPSHNGTASAKPASAAPAPARANAFMPPLLHAARALKDESKQTESKPAIRPPAPRETPPAAPQLTPDQIEAKQQIESKLAALDAKREQLQTDLLQARRELDALRERLKDSSPDVETATRRVQELRNSLNEVTNQIIDLRPQVPGSPPP